MVVQLQGLTAHVEDVNVLEGVLRREPIRVAGKMRRNLPMNSGTVPPSPLVATLRRERAEAVPQRDLSDARWALFEPTLTAWRKARLDRRPTGQSAKVELRHVSNAILYVNRTGIPWKYLPHGFLGHGTVYFYYAAWRDEGIFAQLNYDLNALVRVKEGRKPAARNRRRRRRQKPRNPRIPCLEKALDGRAERWLDHDAPSSAAGFTLP